MPRFVVLQHELPATHDRAGVHFDWMFELDDGLLTFAVDQLPTRGQTLKAQLLPTHRFEYLDYQGPVSNDRGFVFQWDRGDFLGGWKEEQRWWTVQLYGHRFVGEVEFIKAPEEWEFQFRG